MADRIPSPRALPPVAKIVIIGKGQFGVALAARLRATTPHSIVTTSRRSPTPPAQAVESAHVVILAVPFSAHAKLIPAIVDHLRDDVVVVDASNRAFSQGCRAPTPRPAPVALRKMLPSHIALAKSLNTLSTESLRSLADGPAPGIAVPFAAEAGGAQMVRTLIEQLGFIPYQLGDLSAAGRLEDMPHTLFPRWRGSIVLSLVVWIWWVLYSTLFSYVVHGKDGAPLMSWNRYPLSAYLASTGETAMTLFAITFLGGPLAIVLKALAQPLPRWLVIWLQDRKQLGIAGFVFASAHTIAGAISAGHVDGGWMGQLYSVFGITSYVLFTLLAVSSSGNAATSMSWAEFRATFSWVGNTALALGILHQGVWGAVQLDHVPNASHWVGGGRILPMYWLGMMLPLVVIVLRIVTWLPCVIAISERRAAGFRPPAQLSEERV